MVTPNTTPYKPSPLSFGSPRTSPFRRQSTASPPPTSIQPTTPHSGSRGNTPSVSPSKLKQSQSTEDEPQFLRAVPSLSARPRDLPPSPTRGSLPRNDSISSMMGSHIAERPVSGGPGAIDALSQLTPAQLREMREAFQVLDRDNDGTINRDDVVDMLLNLGLDASTSATTSYFPPGSPQVINLPAYLNSIATFLAPLSSPDELTNAFAAFDDDDSGQIDLSELRDALLHTIPDADLSPLSSSEIDEVVRGFTGRRAFSSKAAKSNGLGGSNRGEVFRYQEFMTGIAGSSETELKAAAHNNE